LVTGITNSRIDDVYEVAQANGALGGKITGAGGGGFLLLYCHEERHDELTSAMERLGLRRMDFHFERQGVATAEVQWDASAFAADGADRNRARVVGVA